MRTGSADELGAWLAGRAASDDRLVLLVDGGSGSGKSVLTSGFVRAWPRDVQVVTLDDVYPGWDGLAAASAAVPGMIAGERPGYRRWDWVRSRPAEWVELDPRADVVVEGCGALTPESARLATFRVWCSLDPGARKRRALERDGELFRPHWDDWERQERHHWRAHRPMGLADVVVRVTSSVG